MAPGAAWGQGAWDKLVYRSLCGHYITHLPQNPDGLLNPPVFLFLRLFATWDKGRAEPCLYPFRSCFRYS